jgi:hypothetical protein
VKILENLQIKMSDELAAFFAKKASKGKKKGVKLAEVADQLERRAKIQVFNF